MRYLVTGGAGFIGSHLVEHLVATGQDVTIVDNFTTGRRENLAPFSASIRIVEGSIVEPRVCVEAAKGVDFVLHQAAVPSVPRSVRDPVTTHDTNVTGTLNMLMAARAAGAQRFVYASSSSAYGDTPVLPKCEDMPTNPRSPYAVSKLAGERYCSAFWHTYGFETVSLRYFNIFGPRQDPASEYAAAVPKFATAALLGNSPTIFGDGEQTRDLTYVANAVRANMLACEAPADKVAGEVFNVGCGERISVNEMWHRIQSLTGSKLEAQYQPERAGDVRDSLASLEKASGLLGYAPEVGLDEGLRHTVDFFAALGQSA
jgi:nucleoside-diphosphate-sugar epimerase